MTPSNSESLLIDNAADAADACDLEQGLQELAQYLDDDFFAEQLDTYDLHPSALGPGGTQVVENEINKLDDVYQQFDEEGEAEDEGKPLDVVEKGVIEARVNDAGGWVSAKSAGPSTGAHGHRRSQDVQEGVAIGPTGQEDDDPMDTAVELGAQDDPMGMATASLAPAAMGSEGVDPMAIEGAARQMQAPHRDPLQPSPPGPIPSQINENAPATAPQTRPRGQPRNSQSAQPSPALTPSSTPAARRDEQKAGGKTAAASFSTATSGRSRTSDDPAAYSVTSSNPSSPTAAALPQPASASNTSPFSTDHVQPDDAQKRPRLRALRPTALALADSLLDARKDLMRSLVKSIRDKKYYVNPIWKHAMESGERLLQEDRAGDLKDVTGAINDILVPNLVRATALSKQLQRTKRAVYDAALSAMLCSKLSFPTIPDADLPSVVKRFLETYRLVVLTYLKSPTAVLFQLPNIHEAVKSLARVKGTELSGRGRFDEIPLHRAGCVTGYLVSTVWKWARRGGKHASIIRRFIPRLVYLGQSREVIKQSTHPIIREVLDKDRGALLYACPDVFCYILWLDAAVDAVLGLSGVDVQSPYWADQRIRELLDTEAHKTVWDEFLVAVKAKEHFEEEPAALEQFAKLFRVPFLSLKVGEYGKRWKQQGRDKEGIAAVSVFIETKEPRMM